MTPPGAGPGCTATACPPPRSSPARSSASSASSATTSLPGEIFGYLLASSGAIALFVYLVIALSQLKMRRELDAEGTEPAVRMWAFPALTYVTIAFIVGVLVLMVIRPGHRLELWLSVALAAVIVAVGVAEAPPDRGTGTLTHAGRGCAHADRTARTPTAARRAHKGHKSAYRPVVDRMRPMTAAPSVSNSITVRLDAARPGDRGQRAHHRHRAQWRAGHRPGRHRLRPPTGCASTSPRRRATQSHAERHRRRHARGARRRDRQGLRPHLPGPPRRQARRSSRRCRSATATTCR